MSPMRSKNVCALLRNVYAGLLAATVAGCSAAGMHGSPVLPDAFLTAVRKADATNATIFVRWPADRKAVERKGPLWISPSTTSIVVEVNGDISMSAIVDAPAATGKPVTTKTTIAVPRGEDTFDFTLYDKKQRSASKPVGNILGSGTVIRTIAANQPNIVKAAVAGVIGGIAVALAPNQSLVVANPITGGFDFIGGQPVTLVATAQDADGNALVPQPADLTLQPSVSSSAYLRVTQPKADRRAHEFVVALTAGRPQGQNVAVIARASDTFGDRVEQSVLISPAAAMYVAFGKAPSHVSKIVLYDAGTAAEVSLSSGAFAGIGSISALAYDSIDQRVLVGDRTNGVVDAFDVGGNAVSGFTPIVASHVNAIAFDSQNHEIYLDGSSGVKAYTTSGAPVSLPSGAFGQTASPGPLAVTQSNSIVVGQSDDGSISAYSASGAYATASSLPLSAVLGIAADASSSTSMTASDVFAIGTPLGSTETSIFDVTPGQGPLAVARIAGAQAVAQDPNTQTVYVASDSSNGLIPLAYGTWRRGRTITAPSGYGDPIAITISY
jgi:hypothetical protein